MIPQTQDERIGMEDPRRSGGGTDDPFVRAGAAAPRRRAAAPNALALPRAWMNNGWTRMHVALLAVLGVAAVLTTIDAWVDILRFAIRDEEYSHVLLVPIVTAWLIWVRRGRFRRCRPRGGWMGVLMIALGWAGYSLGDTYLIQVLWHGGALVVVLGALFTVLGTEVFFAFLSAVLLQLFVIPVPGRIRQAIAIPLDGVTTGITQHACDLLGVVAERSGNVLKINGQQVKIAEACNGLRMVFALTLVSFAFAFGTPLRSYVRAMILLASPLSAIFCNVVRLVPTVCIYGYWPEQFANDFHSVSGWFMLPLAFLILMGIIRLLRWALVPVTVFTLAYD